jgi:hypothetical protein
VKRSQDTRLCKIERDLAGTTDLAIAINNAVDRLKARLAALAAEIGQPDDAVVKAINTLEQRLADVEGCAGYVSANRFSLLTEAPAGARDVEAV